jgi:ankyrin repeat protein
MVNILPPLEPDMPEPAPGMALSVAPSPHYLWLEDYEYYDQLGRDPLQVKKIWRISDPEERVGKLEEILEKFPKQKHKRQMLFQAAKRGDEKVVRCILATGIRPNPDIPDASEEDRSGSENVSNKDIDSEKVVDNDQKENGNNNDDKAGGKEHVTNDDEETFSIPDEDDPSVAPLHMATVAGHLAIVKIFIEEAKLDIETRDEFGRTPLLAAAGPSKLEVLRYLLGQGADPTARTNTTGIAKEYLGEFAGADALEFAAVHGELEVLQLLLEHPFYGATRKRKFLEDAQPGVWVTPLAIKSAAGANVEALKLLLERGGYPMEEKDGKTKAELLSLREKQAIAEATPVALESGDLESIKLLLSYQYPIDKDGKLLPFNVPEYLHKPFTWGTYHAVVSNRPDKFEYIKSFGIREHDTMCLDDLPEGQTINIQNLLEDAAEAGSVDCVKLLIDKYGADPNAHRKPPGHKPLYMAAANGKTEMVKLLLEDYGVDIHLGSGRYATGPTALWIAITLKGYGCIEQLLRRGGPIDEIDDEIFDAQEPIDAILRASEPDGKPEVHLMTTKRAEEYVRSACDNWRNPNQSYVRLQIAANDKEWMSSLKPRRADELLRETGARARKLGPDDNNMKDGDGDDVRRLMVSFPTVLDRMEELDKIDDLIPKWRPAYV